MNDPLDSIILNTDSYKYSMYKLYNKGITGVYSHIIARSGASPEVVMAGTQMFIKKYLERKITQEDIDVAEPIITAHGEPFNREGWEYIVNKLNGNLPIRIKAVPEGTVVPIGKVLATIENTDPECAWLTTFVETALLRAIWYPSAVASNAYHSKKIILQYLEETGTPEAIDFKLHDFGARGVSSYESSAIGGVSHLMIFKGTDNIPALVQAKRYYNSDIAGYSIPASEHSISSSWGKEGQADYVLNMLKTYGDKYKLLALVADTYNVFEFCEMIGTNPKVKQAILEYSASGGKLVVRPDSGDPSEVVLKCAEILAKHFGTTTNDKGYRVINHVSIIQGDGIDHASIRSILFTLKIAGFSADNVTFGQGGALLQHPRRDDHGFAMKASSVYFENGWNDIGKEPITDNGKRSLKGRVYLARDADGEYYNVVEGNNESAIAPSVLALVYENGKGFLNDTLDEIRQRVII